MKVNHVRLIAWAAFAALAGGLVPSTPRNSLFTAPMALAQNLGQRTVAGNVVDGNSMSVSGAVVFLKNLKTKAIRSYTTTKSGRFHFAQVNMVDDYDLWAEKGNRKSDTKTVSSWDSRKDYQTELKMK